ncbi:hypothetical protein ILT44_25955 [Microvirga sp. BT689]|uniref:hypothetical protein n=1 Tax=Microvirga arvi TaxID=2778731 RepID=UPI001950B0C0|nr:hypothetical protein [Microvirga arvi]MBM6583649.1 hypothetical protein [Microvirga arvi]
MVNPLGINGQSTPAKNGGKSIESSSDNSLAENSQENLDARLDHAIEETFPTSDPVSVTITKGPEPDGPDQGARSPSAGDQGGPPEQDSTEKILDHVREALHDVADQASGAARDMYSRGEDYARQAREQYPEAERYIREGRRAVTERVAGNPLLALLMAGAIGYALAWMIHGQQRTREAHVPDYGRTDRGYAPHRET